MALRLRCRNSARIWRGEVGKMANGTEKKERSGLFGEDDDVEEGEVRKKSMRDLMD
jgi:hypothetical protein